MLAVQESAAMDDFSSISVLSLAMLVGCYVAGTIPLAVNFSEVIVEPIYRQLLISSEPLYHHHVD